jgi:hypothetical protein
MFIEAKKRMAAMEEKLQKLEREMRRDEEGGNEMGKSEE